MSNISKSCLHLSSKFDYMQSVPTKKNTQMFYSLFCFVHCTSSNDHRICTHPKYSGIEKSQQIHRLCHTLDMAWKWNVFRFGINGCIDHTFGNGIVLMILPLFRCVCVFSAMHTTACNIYEMRAVDLKIASRVILEGNDNNISVSFIRRAILTIFVYVIYCAWPYIRVYNDSVVFQFLSCFFVCLIVRAATIKDTQACCIQNSPFHCSTCSLPTNLFLSNQ